MPHVHLVYLVRGALAAQLKSAFEHPELDPDMAFTHFIRSQLQVCLVLPERGRCSVRKNQFGEFFFLCIKLFR